MGVKVCEGLKWVVVDKQHYLPYEKEGKNYYKDQNEKERVVPSDHVIHNGFSMDRFLKKTLDSMCHNVENDMDFVLVITGSGDVRVGKSTIGMQVGYYLSNRLEKEFKLDNVTFTSREFMNKAEKKGKQVIMYDEAREGLNTGMAMAYIQKQLLQFFAECGQLNNIYILVLPCFFELSKRLAINRSDLLIDCYFKRSEAKDKYGDTVTEKKRGNFRILMKPNKKFLYLNGKEHLNYHPKNLRCLYGGCNNIYVFDEWRYRQKKRAALKNTKKGEEKTKKEMVTEVLNMTNLRLKEKIPTLKQIERAYILGIHRNTLSKWDNSPETQHKGKDKPLRNDETLLSKPKDNAQSLKDVSKQENKRLKPLSFDRNIQSLNTNQPEPQEVLP